MDINLKGKSSVLSKNELLYCVNFFAEHLLGKRLKNNIFLEIEQRKIDDLNVYALIQPTDYGYREHREFELVLNSKEIKRYDLMIRTIAHEMVHLKQFARGELKNLECSTYRWKGEILESPESHHGYKKMPWEQEAYSREKELYNLYKEHLKEHNLEF